MKIINYFIRTVIFFISIFIISIILFEVFPPKTSVSKPYIIKNECIESMKKIQIATYFFLMENIKYNDIITVELLKTKNYLSTNDFFCQCFKKNSNCYTISYKRNKKEIYFIDVTCNVHGSLSKQDSSDKVKGLPQGFLENYIAKVKTKLDLY